MDGPPAPQRCSFCRWTAEEVAALPDGRVVCAACVARIIGAVDEAASREP